MSKIASTLSVMGIVVLVSLACSSLSDRDSDNNGSSLISWDDLRATPRPDGTLCWDVSALGERSRENMKQFRYGLVMGVEIPNAQFIGFQTFEIPPGEPPATQLYLWYGEENTREAEIRLFVLLDEQQLSAFGSGQDYDDVVISVGQEMTIPFTVPSLSPGIHDLIVIGIPYLDEYYPDPHGLVKVLSSRFTLVIPPLTSPFRQIEFTMQPAKGLLSRGAPMVPLMLSLKEKEELEVWNWPDPWLNTEVESVEFFVWAGHEYVVNVDVPDLPETEHSFFALTMFVDYRQVEIEPGSRVLYWKVSKDTGYTGRRVRLDGLQEGRHHILVLKINYPGVPMCVLQGPMPEGRILPFSVYGTLVGVNVSQE